MKIQVTYIQTYLIRDKNGVFRCQHPSTTIDIDEQYDHYKEAVTGTPQPARGILYETCLDCEKQLSDNL